MLQWNYNCTDFLIRRWMECVRLHPRGSNVLKKRLGELQSRYGSWGEETNTLSPSHRSQKRTGVTKRQMWGMSCLWFRTKIRGFNIFDKKKNVTRRDGKRKEIQTSRLPVQMSGDHMHSFMDWGGGNFRLVALLPHVTTSFSLYICQVLQSSVFITTLYLWSVGTIPKDLATLIVFVCFAS